MREGGAVLICRTSTLLTASAPLRGSIRTSKGPLNHRASTPLILSVGSAATEVEGCGSLQCAAEMSCERPSATPFDFVDTEPVEVLRVSGVVIRKCNFGRPSQCDGYVQNADNVIQSGVEGSHLAQPTISRAPSAHPDSRVDR